MARQGYCGECGHRVLLGADGLCPRGHAPEGLADVRDATPEDEARLSALAEGRPAVSPVRPALRRSSDTVAAVGGYAVALLAAAVVFLGSRLLGFPAGLMRWLPAVVAAVVAYPLAYVVLRRGRK